MKEWTKEEIDSVCELVGGNVEEVIRQLQSRLESMEKDAARYRWLRNYHDGECGIVDEFPHIAAGSLCDDAWALSGRKADAAIDTAMQANKD